MDSEDLRKDLAALRRRLALGEIDEEVYQRQRRLILEDLTPQEKRELGTPTPEPAGSGAHLRPSGAAGSGVRTALPSLADLTLDPGTLLFDQWRIERELGRGGFGVVFAAHELLLDERQAIKILDPAMVARAELLARFRREVGLMRRLIHPRVVRVYDYRENLELGQALIGMEYVAGGSLKDLAAAARETGEPLPLPLILGILSQILEALAAAHAQGVIHRDVTPGNVLLAGGSPAELLASSERDPGVKLVDFGIAALAERSELSEKSRVLGTAAYVAPEILDPSAGKPQPAADVYGCGAVVYELLTGEPPLGRFERPSALRPGLPVLVETFVMEMLSRRPRQRPSAVKALKQCREIAVFLEQEERTLAEAETRRRAAQEEQRRAEAEARRKAEEAEKQRQAEAEAKRQAEEAEKQRQAEMRRQAEEAESQAEARRQAEEERRQAEAETRRRAEEAEKQRQAEAQRQAEEVKQRRTGAEARPKVPLMRRALFAAAGASLALVLIGVASDLITRFFQEERQPPSAATPIVALAETHGLKMITLAGGIFQMGSESGDEDERPVHRVEIASFQISKTEITVAQYRACVEAKACVEPGTGEYCNWGRDDRDDHPINCVSWNDARAFAAWVDARLPSEAEWEYAARSQGQARAYPWGDEEADCKRAIVSAPGIGDGCGRESTWPVCAKAAGNTEQGLCDMAGNVWEWVEDDWHSSYDGAPEDERAWSDEPRAAYRVLRGGSWRLGPRSARVADRSGDDPSRRYDYVGFRVARSLPSAL